MEKKYFTKPLIAACSALLLAAGADIAGTESAMAGSPDSPDSSQMESDSSSDTQQGNLPVQAIQNIIGAQGHVDNGVLDIEIARTDIGDVQGPHKQESSEKSLPEVPNADVTFNSAFEIHGDLYFQPLRGGRALLNGDMALTEEEVDLFISALRKNGLVFQAFHQHLPMHPQVWFEHFRGVGKPLDLARAIKAAMDAIHVPSQTSSSNPPTTPLNVGKLEEILHGTATVGDEGVVTVTVERTDPVIVGGVRVNPDAGISTTIEFKPLSMSSDEEADVVPDFSMTAKEVDPVIDLMLNGKDKNGKDMNWYQGCLYNQETAEIPQLYFDHMLKHGNPYELAAQIRQGLNLTHSK